MILAAILIAVAAQAAEKPHVDPLLIAGGALDCTGATSMTCGDVVNGVGGAGGNVDNTYGCTGLSYAGCQEVVYEVCIASTGDLIVDMTYAHDSSTQDLDLFLLGSCNEADCLDSSTGTSGVEQVSAVVAAGTYYVVVDGWGGRCDGSGHTVSVTCDAPCTPVPVDAETWSKIKADYR